MRWKGIKGDCWNRFIPLRYDDVINKCSCCILDSWHHQQHNGLWAGGSLLLSPVGSLLVFLSTEHLGTSRIPMKNLKPCCLCSPALQEGVAWTPCFRFHGHWVFKRDYFRKCGRAKCDIWFTLFWDFKLWCKLVWNRSSFHFLFSKCNTVKWQRLITKVITGAKQRDSYKRQSCDDQVFLDNYA